MVKPTTIAASEADLVRSVRMLSDAGAACIQVRTREPYRAAMTLRRAFLVGKDTSPYREWDCINGMRMFTAENYTDPMVPAASADNPMNDLFSALNLINTMRRDLRSDLYVNAKALHQFVYINPGPFLNQPPMVELLCQLANNLPTSNVCVLLVTADEPLSSIPQGMLQVTSLATPSADELSQIIRNLLQDAGRHSDSAGAFRDGMDIDDDDLARIAHMGAGMTAFEFETYAAIAVIEAQLRADTQLTADVLMEGISRGKTEIVKQSDMLELMAPTDMSEVGGMDGLKEWLAQRADCFGDEAREFGIETPKGIVVCGVAGTGKSLVGRSVASLFGLPLVRFDVASVFSKYVGDSEQRMRAALKLIESMAPVCVLIDEVDKALGGASGGGSDGGASSRVFGTLLSWLQDCKAPVFIVATANRTQGLPAEFLRKGRFDQIFSVGMPDAAERQQVLKVHLRKRGRDIASFSDADLSVFSTKSEGYVPAEIEAAVKDGLILAFHNRESLQMKHILAALEDTVPMSISNAAQVSEIVEWASRNATPVTKKPTRAQVSPGNNVRRMRARNTTKES